MLMGHVILNLLRQGPISKLHRFRTLTRQVQRPGFVSWHCCWPELPTIATEPL